MHASVLKYFTEVARCGSMRKAAQHLFVAPSAINRQIRNLEDELAVELFDRLPSGLKLTPAGERLLKHIRETLDGFHAMRAEFDAMKGERTGHISVIAMDSAMEKLLPAVIDDFGELFPAVTYAIQYASLSKVAERVASGQFDIGISFCQKAPAGTRIAATASFASGAVLSASHPLAKKDLVTFEECREYPIFQTGVADELPSPLSLEYSRHWEETKVHMQSNSIRVIKSMVVRGRGVGFFTRLGFIDEIDRNEVVWRPIAGVSDNTPPVAILVPSPKELSPICEEFLNCLIRFFKQFEAMTENGH